jgi:hypothetical protein
MVASGAHARAVRRRTRQRLDGRGFCNSLRRRVLRDMSGCVGAPASVCNRLAPFPQRREDGVKLGRPCHHWRNPGQGPGSWGVGEAVVHHACTLAQHGTTRAGTVWPLVLCASCSGHEGAESLSTMSPRLGAVAGNERGDGPRAIVGAGNAAAVAVPRPCGRRALAATGEALDAGSAGERGGRVPEARTCHVSARSASVWGIQRMDC